MLLVTGHWSLVTGYCADETSKPLAIKAAKILTVTRGTIDNGVIVIRDKKIAAVGKQGEVAIPPDAEVIDASDRWVMPGQIDLHAHIGNNSGLHDYVHSLNPELRVWDYIDPDSPQVLDALASGVTCINTIPGSGGNHSGFGVIWKLGGGTREELIVRKLGTMKIAQAYNPERRAGDLGLSRMGMWWMLREMFTRAQKYNAAWEDYEKRKKETAPLLTASNHPTSVASSPPQPATRNSQPALRLDLEQIRQVIQRKTPVFVHTASGRDVFMTMKMFHDDLKLPVVCSHCEFGAFRVAEEAGKRNLPVNIGPRLYDFAAQVYDRKFYSLPTEYFRGGVQKLSLNTDCPVIPGEELFLQGTLAVRLGLDEDTALRALTIVPAESVGIADRVGSIEVGKDADLVIKKGSLFDVRTPVDMVLINGKVVYRHGQKRRGTGFGRLMVHEKHECCGDGHDE
ncbi:MAG: amidohydrolase family protein [Abditibacteriales bacterium]|nr:amidohydrolase family protein [Abditibacteriales bacterium]MDW8368067.1 amidohydrolase family protein [Abditibacteriales bacterium]